MQANTVQCTVCQRWIHKRYNGVHGNLLFVVDGFRCNRCDGISPLFLTGDYIHVHDNSNTDP